MPKESPFIVPPDPEFRRGDPIEISFQGRGMIARSGDSLATALLGAGCPVMSRSIKYGHPRGYRCGRGRCACCLVEVNGVPNVRACVTPARDGDRVVLQDFHPVSGRILRPILDKLSRFFSTGFYYRYFTRPAFLQRLFMAQLRAQTGVGRVDAPGMSRRGAVTGPAGIERDEKEEALEPRLQSQVVVVGAGLSGLSAAIEAARSGRSVLLIDEYAWLGGHSRIDRGCDQDLDTAWRKAESLAEEVRTETGVRVLERTLVAGYYDDRTLALLKNGSLSEVGFEQLIVANGAADGCPAFEGSDLPGIFGPRALKLLVNRDGLRPGTRAVVCGGGRESLVAASLLDRLGVRVQAVLWSDQDWGTWSPPQEESVLARLADRGVRVLRNYVPLEAHGKERVERLRVAPSSFPLFTDDGLPSLPGSEELGQEWIGADLVVPCAPQHPLFELPHQIGCELVYDAGRGGFVPVRRDDGTASPGWVAIVGEAAGTFDPSEKISEGRRAARALLGRAGSMSAR